MNLAELDNELARLEVALFEAETMKEWDITVHRYNALKLDRCRMTGDPITSISVSIDSKQILNIRK